VSTRGARGRAECARDIWQGHVQGAGSAGSGVGVCVTPVCSHGVRGWGLGRMQWGGGGAGWGMQTDDNEMNAKALRKRGRR
jgi:hypothetical protein